MIRIVHLLSRPGGGAEAYIDVLAALEGFEHERFVLSTGRRQRLAALSVLARRRRAARMAGEADVVHVHGETTAMLVAPILRRNPSVLTTHGLHRLRRKPRGPGRWAAARGVAAADRTICTSAAECEELRALIPSLPEGRLFVIPNGVPVRQRVLDEERAAARRALGLADDEVAALFLGRLEARKDPLAAVCAVRAARERCPGLVLLVAGDGPLAGEVATQGGEAVRRLGFRQDLLPLYAAADLFLLPSRREGMSIALLDAMSLGLPVVVADAPGMDEAVAEGAGIVVPVGDVGALADSLVELASDAALRRRLGDAARERVSSKLGIGSFLDRTAAVYRDVLKGG